MSDYSFYTTVSRDELASELGDNEEQFVYTLALAFELVNVDQAIELGSLPYAADAGALVLRLRDLANAIEDGSIT